jgi:chromosome segregation ATPase
MKEEIIVALLENISDRIINKTGSEAGEAKNIKAQVAEKQAKIKQSITTLEEAKSQYLSLKVKMQRFETLDETLKAEIKNFNEKIEKYRNDISTKYDRIDYQKEYYTKQEEKMNEIMKFLEKNRMNFSQAVKFIFTNIAWSLIIKKQNKNYQIRRITLI